jgi:hypothetical protein
MNYDRLCSLCEQFLAWDAPDEQKWGGVAFSHHPTGTALRKSIERRCHLCTILQNALENSRRPDGEICLPERQIYLQHVLPTLIEEYLQIEISVQPESLATAGKHNHLALTDRTSVQVTGAECQASMPEVDNGL